MKTNLSRIGYICIGLSVYFLIYQLQLNMFENFYYIHTIIGIIGISYIVYSQTKNDPVYLLIGSFLFGISIHLYCTMFYPNWPSYWAMYLLILGMSFLLYYIQTKKQLVTGLITVSLALILLVNFRFPTLFESIPFIFDFIDTFWPLSLLGFGIYFIKKH
ncbi:MAG TPA: hypothetical protein VK075_07105 [Pseudogracilibacillus sp.]|nr:hypothetical protein [Pseudogracilibacillus sp.]